MDGLLIVCRAASPNTKYPEEMTYALRYIVVALEEKR